MNIPTGALERVLWGHMFGISDLSVYREGRALASAGDATVRLWSLEHAEDSSELTSLEPDVSCTLFARKREVLYAQLPAPVIFMFCTVKIFLPLDPAHYTCYYTCNF